MNIEAMKAVKEQGPTPKERIRVLVERLDGNYWPLADRLSGLEPVEYEKQLPQIIKETGLSRPQLTAVRMTALRWPKERRLADVPFATHRRFRYDPEELERQHKSGMLGVEPQSKRRQAFTLTNMAAAISAVLELAEAPRVSAAEFRKQVRAILGQFRRDSENTAAKTEDKPALRAPEGRSSSEQTCTS